MYVRARARVYVQSIYLVGGGLIIEANIPVQELEGQRGEGAYFREDTVIDLYYTSLQNFIIILHDDYIIIIHAETSQAAKDETGSYM